MYAATQSEIRSVALEAINTDFLSIVLKVSERCNLACPYCYFFFSGDDTYKLHPPYMSEATVSEVVDFVRRLQEESGIRNVRIGLHGGEPLLLKKQRFRDACLQLRAAFGREPELTLGMQTNAVLIDADWIDVFEECKLRIGVSIDGDEQIHNRTRITRKGNGTYAQTRRGWEMLVEAANQSRLRYPGLLCVVSPEHSGKAVFEHFVHELHAREMNFLLPDVTYDTAGLDRTYFEGCGDFLVEVCRAWFECGEPNIRVRFIDEAIGPMLSDSLHQRSASLHDPLGQACISSDGELCPDDVIRGYAAHFTNTGQHVRHSTLGSMAVSQAWQELRHAYASVPEPCTSCTWRSICRGGQLQHRYSAGNGFNNPSIHCAALKRMYGYVASRLVASGYDAAEIERRLGIGKEQ